MKHIKLFEEFVNGSVNEGLKDMLADVRSLAKEMANKYADDAEQYIDVDSISSKINPERDIKKIESKFIKEVSLDEGLVDKIKEYSKGVRNISFLATVGSLGGVVAAYIDAADHRLTEWYYREIQKLADWQIHDLLAQKHGIEASISDWEAMVLKYAFLVFFIIYIVSAVVYKVSNKK